MKLNRLIIIQLLVLLYSCNQRDYNGDINEPEFDKIINLKSEVIDINPHFMNRTQDMVLVDDYLFIEDYNQSEYVFKVFNTKLSKIVQDFCRRGKGPGEVLYPTSNVSYNNIQKELQLFDPNLKKLITININKKDELNFKSADCKIPNTKEFITQVFKLNNYFLSYASNGFSKGKRFSLLDSNMSTVKNIGDINKPLSVISDNDWYSILGYSSHFELKPDASKLVIGTYIGGFLEILDLQNPKNDISIIDSKLIYPPIYDYMTHGDHKHIKWTSDSFIGFEDIFVTDNYIYTLLNGCRGNNYTLPNKISVFDWTGKPVVQYQLDKEICSLAVDEKGGIIYATEYTKDASNLIFFKL